MIQRWIRQFFSKLFTTKQSTNAHHALPHDIVVNNVLPLLALPSYTSEVEDHGDHEEDEMDVEKEMEE